MPRSRVRTRGFTLPARQAPPQTIFLISPPVPSLSPQRRLHPNSPPHPSPPACFCWVQASSAPLEPHDAASSHRLHLPGTPSPHPFSTSAKRDGAFPSRLQRTITADPSSVSCLTACRARWASP